MLNFLSFTITRFFEEIRKANFPKSSLKHRNRVLIWNQKKHQKMDYKELQQIDCWEIDDLINQSPELCIYKGKI